MDDSKTDKTDKPDTADTPARPELRLHPWSWLFVLLTRLRPFVLPALVLLFVGSGSTWELYGAGFAVVLAIYSLIYSLWFRYRLDDDELVVREGVLFRTVRHVPFVRVQSVVQRRSALHRLFGVTELRLESMGGTRPEAVMNVISATEADRLEHMLRDAARSPRPELTTTGAADGAAAVDQTLVRLGTGEIARLGLISRRGWLVVGVAVGLYWQLAPEEHRISKLIESFFESMFAGWNQTGFGWQTAGYAALSLLALLVLLRAFSIAVTFLMFHGFRLTRQDGRLSTTCGLLTSRSASARTERIQRYVWREPMMARLLGRRLLSCDVAVFRGEGDDELSRLHWLMPIGTPQQVETLLATLDPTVARERDWQPLHSAAWKRVFKVYFILAMLVGIGLALPLGWWALAPGAMLAVLSWFAARGWARFAAWSLDAGVFTFRAGWLGRAWTTTLVTDGHSATLAESPFDRRRGMASVRLATAGASQTLFPLNVPYLKLGDAMAIHAALSCGLAAAHPA